MTDEHRRTRSRALEYQCPENRAREAQHQEETGREKLTDDLGGRRKKQAGGQQNDGWVPKERRQAQQKVGEPQLRVGQRGQESTGQRKSRKPQDLEFADFWAVVSFE